jgi:hypothetical protein
MGNQSHGAGKQEPRYHRKDNVGDRGRSIGNEIANNNAETPEHWNGVDELVKHIKGNIRMSPQDLAIYKD